ncbi:hypothetical protein N7457_004564 [Penicillium paradoxum]|uniref:uncharacterized protein n=1 Tax=Penicillium paradoxum TaxID=176176 RepID=UPI002546FA4F|nr:uncharacterized protein N7457_004564 [Penicillium paradoxum]KAJ5782790.1 hypothetical protein N7457_004564 [Penicillium paradoxum]
MSALDSVDVGTPPPVLESSKIFAATRTPAPQRSRSDFPIIPIILMTAISSGAYVFLVKSRVGNNPSRSN